MPESIRQEICFVEHCGPFSKLDIANREGLDPFPPKYKEMEVKWIIT